MRYQKYRPREAMIWLWNEIKHISFHLPSHFISYFSWAANKWLCRQLPVIYHLSGAHHSPEYTIELYHADDLVGTLKEYWNAIAAIINVPPHQDGNEAPHPFGWNRLRDVFPTPEAAIRTRAEAIRASLTYSGFLGWWTTSIHDWTKDLPELMVYKIRRIVNEGGSARQGVLVDLQNDWRELSIAHWMANHPWL